MEAKFDESYSTPKTSRVWPIITSTAVCGTIGALISFVTNCTLAEISTNAFFSLYFGLFFIFIG
jgi:hypothetical protein